MVEFASAAVVLSVWNTITLHHFRVVVVAMYQTFNCFVSPATGVNRTVVHVKSTTNGLVRIAVMVRQQESPLFLRSNVLVQRKKVRDVKTKRLIQTVGVTYIKTNINKYINMSILFAVDTASEETIISQSQKGSKSVEFRERVRRSENEPLYNAVVALTSITKAPDFDVAIFKSMDKVCQMIYKKHNEKA